jgi:hypothetical protein
LLFLRGNLEVKHNGNNMLSVWKFCLEVGVFTKSNGSTNSLGCDVYCP